MRRVIVILLGLALVLVGLDFAARAAAEAAVAGHLQAAEGLPQRPDVRVSGFPFLLQAAAGVYQQVDVRGQDVPAGSVLRLDQVDARLTGVHLPPSALLGSRLGDVPVDAVRVTGTTSHTALAAQVAAAIPGDVATVQFADGGGGNRLRVSVTYHGPGGPLSLSGPASVSIVQGRLAVKVSEDVLAQIPPMLRSAVSPLLARVVPLQQLPLDLVPSAVAITPAGVTVTAESKNAVLRSQRSR
jgi:hypothetical protein